MKSTVPKVFRDWVNDHLDKYFEKVVDPNGQLIREAVPGYDRTKFFTAVKKKFTKSRYYTNKTKKAATNDPLESESQPANPGPSRNESPPANQAPLEDESPPANQEPSGDDSLPSDIEEDQSQSLLSSEDFDWI